MATNNPNKNRVTSDEFIKVKHRGRIYTPDYLVKIILDQGHYTVGSTRKKHVIDNSCGDGQFLIHVVDRYCTDFLRQCDDLTLLHEELETYIHAIEIDQSELEVCISRCNQVAALYGVFGVSWDFVCGDALKITQFDGRMDFVVGNPPYVRVHNLNEDFLAVKSFSFSNAGMTDLFIVFYELGLKMLNDHGILCYITPSSFFTSLAGSNMRTHFTENKLLESVCDLKHFQAFSSTTYTTIVCLNKQRNSADVMYYEFDEESRCPIFVCLIPETKYYINNCYYFSTVDNLALLADILQSKRSSNISIKNGYATLADKVFIGNFPFPSKYVIPVLKGSRAQWSHIFYPYNKDSTLIPEHELKQDEDLYAYLLEHKQQLLSRSIEKGTTAWYAFGRSQAIHDTYKEKIAINALIRDASDLKVVDVPSGCGVYSGLYILSPLIDSHIIKEALLTHEFGVYISLLGKYKSGGYYTFSSKDIKKYLDYKLGLEENLDANEQTVS